jgi:hypothetical protein
MVGYNLSVNGRITIQPDKGRNMEQLNQAISEAKAGNKETARRLLADIIKAEPQNELAWLWFSACVDNIEQKKYCLSKALAINPANQNAKKALEKLNPLPQPSPEEISTTPKVVEEPKAISLPLTSAQIKPTQQIQLQKQPDLKAKPNRNWSPTPKNKQTASRIILPVITIFAVIGIVIILIILVNAFRKKGNPVNPTQIAVNPTSTEPVATSLPTEKSTEAISPTPSPTNIPTLTPELVVGPLWPTTTEQGNQIIQKILTALSDGGVQIVDPVYYTDVSDPNKLLGRPHQYIAKASWRDPTIASEGKASVDNGGSIEVLLTSADLQARYDYVDKITSSSAMFTEYHYQNAPAFIRLSKAYLPSQAQMIADIVLAIKFDR